MESITTTNNGGGLIEQTFQSSRDSSVKLDANGMTPEEVAVLAKMEGISVQKDVPPEPGNAPQSPADSEGDQKPPTDWEKAYKELERQYSKDKNEWLKKSKKTPPEPGNAPQSPADSEGGQKPKEAPENAPQATETPEAKDPKSKTEIFSEMFDEATTEFLQSGKLSDETYQKIEESSGMSRAVVDRIVNAEKAEVSQIRNEALSILDSDPSGAQQMYMDLLKWADGEGGLSKSEKDAFNKVITDNPRNVEILKSQVEYLKNRYERANGSIKHSHITGNADSSHQSHRADVFESFSDLRAAMNDKRYGRDASYTNAVDSKAARSPNI